MHTKWRWERYMSKSINLARTAPFVGRDGEMSTLHGAYEATADGEGSVVLIVGEAGIGKTRLLNEYGAWVATQRGDLLMATCYEGEVTPPFGPWIDAIRDYASTLDSELLSELLTGVTDEVATLFPEFRALLSDGGAPEEMSPADSRIRLFSAIRQFIRNCASSRPVAIAIDNLQWADRDSLSLLHHLAVDLNRHPVIILGTFRQSELESSDSLAQILPNLAKLDGFLRISPRNLRRDEVMEYVLSAAGDQGVDPQIIFERSQGNPFFMNEILRMESDNISTIPDTIRETIKRRLELLDTQAMEILSAAAVVGRSFAFTELESLFHDLTNSELLDHIQTVLDTGIIEHVEKMSEYVFSHVLFQEYLLQRLSPSTRSRYHKRLADALLDNLSKPNGPEILKLFRHMSDLALVEKVDDYPTVILEAASFSLGVHALEEALAILDTGLERLPPGDEGVDVARLHQLKGLVLFNLRKPEGKEYFASAFNLFVRHGYYDRAVECAVHPFVVAVPVGEMTFWEIVEHGNTELIRRALAFVKKNTVQRYWLELYAPTWEDFLKADYEKLLRGIVEAAQKLGQDDLEFHARLRLARWYYSVTRLEDCRDEERRAEALLEKLDDPIIRRRFYFFSNFHYTSFGEPERAIQGAQYALELAEDSGTRESISSAVHVATHVNYVAGNWTECFRFANRNLTLNHGGPRSLFNEFARAALIVIAFERGEWETGEAHIAQLIADVGETRSPMMFISPRLARVTGKIDDPQNLLADLQSIPCHPESRYNWYDLYRQIALAELAIYLSNRDLIEEMIDWFTPLKGTFFPGDVVGRSSDSVLADLYVSLGMVEEASEHYEDALRFCKAGFLPELAWTNYRYACVLDKDAERRCTVLNEALEIATQLKMAPLAKLIAEKSGSGNGESAPAPDGLTDRELEVLILVTRGLTNQEIAEKLFISPRTAAQHVRNIFYKTGMANRAEATSYAFRNGLAD